MRFSLLSLSTIFIFFVSASAQQPQTADHPGVILYRQGQYAEAAKTLSLAVKDKYWKSNATLWNFLSLSYIETNKYKDARKAIQNAIKIDGNNSAYRSNLSYIYLRSNQPDKAITEADKAVSLDPRNVSAIYMRGTASYRLNKLDAAESDAGRMMTLDSTDARGYVLQSYVLMAKLQEKLQSDPNATIRENVDYLRQAHDILISGLKKASNNKIIADEFESIDAFYQHFTKEPRKPGDDPEPGVTSIKLTYKPKAVYTDEARSSNVQGTVRLAVLLGANGKVQGVLVLKRLGHGLDENAIRAARAIQFEPKMKDGKPISTVVTMEYGFNIY